MNDYLFGAIAACDVLTETKAEFTNALIKVTGLTKEGIKKNLHIQKIMLDKKS